MRIIDFPYGKITKTLRHAVTWLNRNRRRIEKKYSRMHSFDFPNYWNMPKKFANRLTTDQVDWIQAETDRWNFKLTEKYEDE
jgi:hypothetical protein